MTQTFWQSMKRTIEKMYGYDFDFSNIVYEKFKNAVKDEYRAFDVIVDGDGNVIDNNIQAGIDFINFLNIIGTIQTTAYSIDPTKVLSYHPTNEEEIRTKMRLAFEFDPLRFFA